MLVVARAPQALHGYTTFAARRGGSVRSAWSADRRDPRVPTETARRYWLRLKGWMRRFHGVATHYLPNYLVWHRWLDHDPTRGSLEPHLPEPLSGP